jgi:hypothetical protein
VPAIDEDLIRKRALETARKYGAKRVEVEEHEDLDGSPVIDVIIRYPTTTKLQMTEELALLSAALREFLRARGDDRWLQVWHRVSGTGGDELNVDFAADLPSGSPPTRRNR